MTIELAHLAVMLAFILSLFQATLPLIGAARGDDALMIAGQRAAQSVFILLMLGFGGLMFAHITDDFSVLNVALNSHTQKPLLYKVAGTWGSHEGSMLLWVLILAGFGAAIASTMPAMPLPLRARAVAVQGMIGVGFLAFILFTSNPFLRLLPVPLEGNDLNPLLQDPGLAFHPPFLYLGYVGFSSVFSLAAALLLTKGVKAADAHFMRLFALFAWGCLTFGIAMGSWWAYYELGWGGFWFWDPVENAALLPWLAGTALVHSLVATIKRGALSRWMVLLSILAFSMSLLGTFLVRSGVLTSVHTFALDPARGVFILVLLTLATGGALALFAARAHTLPGSPLFGMISRESGLLLNNLFLCAACATLLTGTLYPILLDALGGGIVSVGAPYFNATVLPFIFPAVFLAGIGPFLRWKESDLVSALQQLKAAAIIALAALLYGLYCYGVKSVLGLAAFLFGAWMLAATVLDGRRARPGIQDWPRLLAHAGLGIAVLGMAGAAFSQEYVLPFKLHEMKEVGSYRIQLDRLEGVRGPNYEAARATFNIWRGNEFVASLTPEQRLYPVQGMRLADVAIHTNFMRDLYLALGNEDNKAYLARFYINPLAPWIWVGGAIMALGGVSAAFLSRRKA